MALLGPGHSGPLGTLCLASLPPRILCLNYTQGMRMVPLLVGVLSTHMVWEEEEEENGRRREEKRRMTEKEIKEEREGRRE